MNIWFLLFFIIFSSGNTMIGLAKTLDNVKKRLHLYRKTRSISIDSGQSNGQSIGQSNGPSTYLNEVAYHDTTRFIPPIASGKVIKVYDGDTITIASKIPNTDLPIYRFSVRLAKIDSAEIKGQSENEIRLAIEARDALRSLIYGKVVDLRNLGTEKYGRILADVYLENLCVNQWMLDNNYAVPYDGKKKTKVW
jgi:hypothetical protein